MRLGSVESDPVLSVCVCALESASCVVESGCGGNRTLRVLSCGVYRCSTLLSFTAHDRVYMRRAEGSRRSSERLHTKPCCSVFPTLHYLPDKRKLIYSKSCSERNHKEMPKCWKTNLNNPFNPITCMIFDTAISMACTWSKLYWKTGFTYSTTCFLPSNCFIAFSS